MYLQCFTDLVKRFVTTVAQVLFHLNSLRTLLYTVCGKTDVTGCVFITILNYATTSVWAVAHCCPCFLFVDVLPAMGRPVARQGQDTREGISGARVSSQQAVSVVLGRRVSFSERYSFSW